MEVMRRRMRQQKLGKNQRLIPVLLGRMLVEEKKVRGVVWIGGVGGHDGNPAVRHMQGASVLGQRQLHSAPSLHCTTRPHPSEQVSPFFYTQCKKVVLSTLAF